MRAASSHAPLPGTRPEGVRDEREAAARVREMFTRIVPRYDFLNHFLSFSLDRVWRERTAEEFLDVIRRPDANILDLCCGTGDLAFALDRAREKAQCYASGTRSKIVGSDFVQPMLVRAREKAERGGRRAEFAAADALNLPFADGTFDLVATAFGFRNLANYESGLREIVRVLKPGGEIGILEFSEPESGMMAGLFRFYFERVLPLVGGAISGSSEAYSYLPASVTRFPAPQELAELMRRCGFAGVRVKTWNFGSVVLHAARRG
jgi:demethylmenaquinone methyltransferase / 2-methoxy-6-polyprenyl-1,4-benzoquinol methylase